MIQGWVSFMSQFRLKGVRETPSFPTLPLPHQVVSEQASPVTTTNVSMVMRDLHHRFDRIDGALDEILGMVQRLVP